MDFRTPCKQKLAGSATHCYKLPEAMQLYRGGVLRDVTLAYETWGKLNGRADNAILIFTGLSPSAHAASSNIDTTPGWWEYMIGPGKTIDTNQYFVICVNSLGSCFGSTGPMSINPDTDQPWRLSFPALSIEDIAKAANQLLQALEIKHPHTVIGTSLGGMSALAYTFQFPEAANKLIVVSAAAQSTPFAIAIRSLQREMIQTDPNWLDGNYDFDKPPVNGMKLARKLGLTSYRSPEEWQHRFGRKKKIEVELRNRFDHEFEIESYLEHNASKFTGTFDPNCYLYLSRAMDWFDLHDHIRSHQFNFQNLKLKNALVIGVESDLLFPLWQQQELAEILRQGTGEVTFKALESVQGHDAFLVDEKRFAPLFKNFLY